MKGKTIMGLVLAVSLLLIGTFAYAYWSDFGPRSNYGAGCGYGYGHKAAYNANVNDTTVRNFTPCYRYWQGNGNWHAPGNHSNQHGRGNGWTGHRGYGMTGPRGCWQQ
jgi:hypothetical protein